MLSRAAVIEPPGAAPPPKSPRRPVREDSRSREEFELREELRRLRLNIDCLRPTLVLSVVEEERAWRDDVAGVVGAGERDFPKRGMVIDGRLVGLELK